MRPAAVVRLRPALLLPDRPVGGVLESRPVRRRSLRPRATGRPTARWSSVPATRVRRRAEAADHARHVRALSRLLRRLLRAGAAGADADRAGARRGVRTVRRPRHPDVADGRVRDGDKAADPLAMYACDLLTIPLYLAGPPGAQRPVRVLRRAAGRPPADRAAVRRELASSGPATPSSARSASTSSRESFARDLGARHRPRDPRPAEDADEDVLPVPRRVRRRGEHADLPRLSRLPGALPVPNRIAIEWVVKLGLALGCDVAPRAVFSRKNYFYPDLPKGYQISQYDLPSCVNGNMLVPLPNGDHAVGIVRAHLEEDAAKNVTWAAGRGGSVAPTTRWSTTTAAARRWSRSSPRRTSTRRRRRSASSSCCGRRSSSSGSPTRDGEGHAARRLNVSVRPAGTDELRTRCEIKNMNSFTHIARGIDAEIARRSRCGSQAPRWSSTRTTSTSRPGR